MYFISIDDSIYVEENAAITPMLMRTYCRISPPIYKLSSALSSRRQLAQHADTQYHDKQADGHNNEQREGEPAHDHGAGPHATLDNAVSKVLRDDGGGN